MPARRGRRETEPDEGRTVTSRRDQFLIGRRPGLPEGGESLDLGAVRTALEQDPEVTVKRTLTPPGLGPLGVGLAGRQAVIVAEMPRERAEQMNRLPQLLVEPDHPLTLAGSSTGAGVRDLVGVLVPRAAGPTVTVTVTGKERAPVEGANVYLFGEGCPVQAVTDANGQAQLTLVGESVGSVRGLYVKPRADYWSRWVAEPALDPDRPNPVPLTPLDQTFPDFPNREVVGWGIRAMRVDQLPAGHRGHGVRVAVVDSGVARAHPDLHTAVKGGYDAIGQNPQTWDRDEIGHGSHGAGIIAGLDDGRGIRGIAPEAEVFAMKVFPEGRVSHLLDALNRCIELQVDLVNLGLAGDLVADRHSEFLEDKIREMKELGIACVVAAGNTGGPVRDPAASPHVLAVAAVGKFGEFPADSYHGTEIWDGAADGSEEYFSARFTCAGPEIDMCAPGVAILSCVPPNAYAVSDGTSAAAAHVTGLAALVLAHHPDFQELFRARNADRVERLFQVLRQSARPLNLGDPNRTGAGMPDALAALLLPQPAEAAARPEELLQRLLAVLEGGRQMTPAEQVAAVQQMLAALPRAGMAPAAAGAPAGGVEPRFALKQLRGAMQQAGLLPSKSRRAVFAAGRSLGAPPPPPRTPRSSSGVSSAGAASAAPGNGWPMRDLTQVMQQAGLL